MLPRVFPKIDYLAFMGRWSGSVRYNLATSGIAALSARDLPALPADDYGSHARFAAAVAQHYGIDANEVAPCLGASGAIFSGCGTLLNAGDRVLVESPNYEPLWRTAEALGHGVDFFERRPEANFEIEKSAVVAALKPRTRLVVVSNPHNPTAAFTPDSELAALADELAARDGWLLVDEVYRESLHPGLTARTAHPRLITCSSITKCWGVPWARAGWLLMPRELVAKIVNADHCTVGMGPPSSWAYGEHVVTESPALIARAAKLQAGKRARVDAFVTANAQRLSWCPPPSTSPFGWLRDTSGRDLTACLHDAIENLGVLVAPGEYFGDNAAFRLGWTSDEATLAAGLCALERALAALPS